MLPIILDFFSSSNIKSIQSHPPPRTPCADTIPDPSPRHDTMIPQLLRGARPCRLAPRSALSRLPLPLRSVSRSGLSSSCSRRSQTTVIADIHRVRSPSRRASLASGCPGRPTPPKTNRKNPKEPTELDSITRLPNGLRVASEALPGSFSGVGVYVEAGSRFEPARLRGVSHIMDRLAFKSTRTSTAQQTLERVEALGGNIQCASSRESMMYQAATFNSAVGDALGLLADTICHPLVATEEVSEQLLTAEYEINEIWAKPELILPELIHTAAFMGNTLGNPLLCPRESLQSINRDSVLQYRRLLYRPERIVVAFAGVAHDEAVRLATQYFGDMTSEGVPGVDIAGISQQQTQTSSPSSQSSTSQPQQHQTQQQTHQYQQPQKQPQQQQQQQQHQQHQQSTPDQHISLLPPQSPENPTRVASRLLSKVPFFKNLSTSVSRYRSGGADLDDLPTSPDALNAPAHYTGGFISLPPQPPPPNRDTPTFTHIHLAFEGLPISSPHIYALAALQTLLGGGGSFSAGGPGKGMYSRLYTNVLNHHGWVESCVAFNHSYSDSGLFGISASCNPQRIKHMVDEMCAQLAGLTSASGFSSLTRVEVDRAKNQLRSSLLMNLESRMVELEDLGRQVQVHGRKIPVREMCARIQDLTPDDLARTAEMVLSGAVRNPGEGTGAPTVVLQKALTPAAGADITWDYIQDRTSARNLGRRS